MEWSSSRGAIERAFGGEEAVVVVCAWSVAVCETCGGRYRRGVRGGLPGVLVGGLDGRIVNLDWRRRILGLHSRRAPQTGGLDEPVST